MSLEFQWSVNNQLAHWTLWSSLGISRAVTMTLWLRLLFLVTSWCSVLCVFQAMLGIFFSAKSAVLIEDVPFTEEDIRNEWVPFCLFWVRVKVRFSASLSSLSSSFLNVSQVSLISWTFPECLSSPEHFLSVSPLLNVSRVPLLSWMSPKCLSPERLPSPECLPSVSPLLNIFRVSLLS